HTIFSRDWSSDVCSSDLFPKYGHRFSRKDFTLPQLFACLVLRKFFKTDYRGICEYLRDMPALREQLGLSKVPHYTTLQKKEAMRSEERRAGEEGRRRRKR